MPNGQAECFQEETRDMVVTIQNVKDGFFNKHFLTILRCSDDLLDHEWAKRVEEECAMLGLEIPD